MKLNKLRPEIEVFAQGVASGLNGSAAYRAAYKKDFKTDDQSVWDRACRLMSNENVQRRIAEIRAPVLEKAKMTLEMHLLNLKEIRDAAIEAGNYSAAVAAEVARGKASGFYVDKISAAVTVNSLSNASDAYLEKIVTEADDD